MHAFDIIYLKPGDNRGNICINYAMIAGQPFQHFYDNCLILKLAEDNDCLGEIFNWN